MMQHIWCLTITKSTPKELPAHFYCNCTDYGSSVAHEHAWYAVAVIAA